MLMDDCIISHLGVYCLGQILCEVDLPKAIEFHTHNGEWGAHELLNRFEDAIFCVSLSRVQSRIWSTRSSHARTLSHLKNIGRFVCAAKVWAAMCHKGGALCAVHALCEK